VCRVWRLGLREEVERRTCAAEGEERVACLVEGRDAVEEVEPWVLRFGLEGRAEELEIDVRRDEDTGDCGVGVSEKPESWRDIWMASSFGEGRVFCGDVGRVLELVCVMGCSSICEVWKVAASDTEGILE
jgi:hypothetical protein